MEAKRLPCTNKQCKNTVALFFAYAKGGLCVSCYIKPDTRSLDRRDADRHRVDNPQG